MHAEPKLAELPPKRVEFDVDLVLHLPSAGPVSHLRAGKALIADCLEAYATHASTLEEKQRCWRLCYANQFRLDTTLSIANPACGNGGELAPDDPRTVAVNRRSSDPRVTGRPNATNERSMT